MLLAHLWLLDILIKKVGVRNLFRAIAVAVGVRNLFRAKAVGVRNLFRPWSWHGINSGLQLRACLTLCVR